MSFIIYAGPKTWSLHIVCGTLPPSLFILVNKDTNSQYLARKDIGEVKGKERRSHNGRGRMCKKEKESFHGVGIKKKCDPVGWPIGDKTSADET